MRLSLKLGRLSVTSQSTCEKVVKTISVKVTGDANFIVFWFDLFLDRRGVCHLQRSAKDSDGRWYRPPRGLATRRKRKKTRGVVSILAR